MQNRFICCPRCDGTTKVPFGTVVVCDICDYTIATTAAVRYALWLLRRTPDPPGTTDTKGPPESKHSTAGFCQDEV